MIIPAHRNDAQLAPSLISSRVSRLINSLERRKGGGGGGHGSSHGSSHSSSDSDGSSGGDGATAESSSFSKSSAAKSFPVSSSTKTSASAYSEGGGSIVVIPSGSLFGGRQAGGASRVGFSSLFLHMFGILIVGSVYRALYMERRDM